MKYQLTITGRTSFGPEMFSEVIALIEEVKAVYTQSELLDCAERLNSVVHSSDVDSVERLYCYLSSQLARMQPVDEQTDLHQHRAQLLPAEVILLSMQAVFQTCEVISIFPRLSHSACSLAIEAPQSIGVIRMASSTFERHCKQPKPRFLGLVVVTSMCVLCDSELIVST